MKSEATSPEGQCQQCRQHNILIQLACSHGYCVRCTTFAYHKNKLYMNRVSQTRCGRCHQTVDLGENQIKMINQFTDQVLVPLMKEEEEGKNVKSQQQDYSAPTKHVKSHQQSLQKHTPLGTRTIQSKCDSPKFSIPHNNCIFHPDQELSVVCLSCQNAVLCLSCTSGKKHNSHTIKSLAKGMEAIGEQLALSKLRCRQNMGILEVLRRRVEDRRSIVEERSQKAKQSLKLHFDNLIEQIARKRQEMMQSCSDIFNKWTAEVMRDENRVHEALKGGKKQGERLTQVSKMSGGYVEMIKRSTLLIEEVKQFKEPQLECGDLMGIYEWQGVVRDLDMVCQKVERIMPHSNYDFLGATVVKNSKSEEKLLKDNHNKRAKTNVISLNSSRERKEKKYTKTEEDERRNKSRANYKTESNGKLSKVNKNYPAYLVQYLDKNNPLDSFAENNPLTSSFKSTKLLSKSHLPGEDIKRKKEHVALIKERLERKTFNGNTKEHRLNTEGVRKKKIPY